MNKLKILKRVINEIVSWILIKHYDFNLNIYAKSRLWIELWTKWELILYYPIADENLWKINTSSVFNKKDMTTMYFAMLESNCINSKPENRMII